MLYAKLIIAHTSVNGNMAFIMIIVLYERSPHELSGRPECYIHYGRTSFSTGISLDMLQDFILISLDNFHKHMHNKPIETIEEAWLTFLNYDSPLKKRP